MFDASIGALCWWFTGFGIALGSGGDGSVAGSDGYGLDIDPYTKATWLFQWSFAAAAATIVSGAVAERVSFGCYIVYSIVLTGFIYPIVVHAGWGGGIFSAWRSSDLFMGCGVTDFAGSGVVHMCGGVAAFVGAKVVGPRTGRFDGGSVNPIPQQSVIFQTLGTLILWMGWYGFNGVSTLYIGGFGGVAAHTMVTTTISASTCCLVTTALGKKMNGFIDPADANNGILAGLVAITAGCSTVSPIGAFIIGALAAPIYMGASKGLLKMKIDDVVNAVPVHGACGAWGVIAAGLFASPHYYSMAYYSDRAKECAGLFYGGSKLIGANFVFIMFVLLWTGLSTTALFMVCKMTIGVRVSEEMEEAGMDDSKHGGMVDYIGVAPNSTIATVDVKAKESTADA